MGITGLRSRMRRYAKDEVIGCTTVPFVHTGAIIDGPGLAHHCYYSICHKRKYSSSTSGAITYAECAKEVKEWLDFTCELGFEILAILFDGALPASKKPVRISRLQRYAERVSYFKQSNTASSMLLGLALTELPPPPFLVFAVVEELLQTTYKNQTYVVPGEADPYCIAAAHQHPGKVTIFSDDTDLLIYQVNEQTSVAPFRDLKYWPTLGDGGTGCTCDVYFPAKIIQQAHSSLHLEDLIKPAFFMSQDPQCTLEQAFQLLERSDPAAHQDFADFSASYQILSEAKEWASILSDPTKKDALAARDSRISEIIWQSQTLDTLEGGIRVYLPFLTDDPGRSTAWKVGTRIRVLAYAILLQGDEMAVQECRRSGSGVASSLIEPLEADEVEERVREVSEYLDQIFTWADDNQLTDAELWRYVALQQTYQSLSEYGLPMPATQDAMDLVLNKDDRRTWSFVHLSAQYQASFYSLRMLKQLAGHVVAEGNLMSDVFDRLNSQLASLPRIAVFFAENVNMQKAEQWDDLVGSMLESFQEEKEEEEDEEMEGDGFAMLPY